jgi:hypothetical protein
MRINSSNVTLSASQINIATTTKYERLHSWDANSDSTIESYNGAAKVSLKSVAKTDTVALSHPQPTKNSIVKDALAQYSSLIRPPEQKDPVKDILSEYGGDLRTQLIKDIIEALTGKKIDTVDPADLSGQSTGDTAPTQAPSDAQQAPAQPAQPPRPDWGIDYYAKETHYTKEGVSFSANGAVTTADGKSVSFNVSMEMSRETYDEITVSLKAGAAAIDPLMVDLSGTGANLSGVKFEFDLNADGKNESINAPAGSTGFLAYDRNGNGIIDNGAELLGPTTGNGFSELSQMDSDRNGWIDENDAAFNNLKVWQKNADGFDRLTSLRDSGIGAIYTGHAATQYNVAAGSSDSVAGILRETGFLLKEAGGTGIVQEVDLLA